MEPLKHFYHATMQDYEKKHRKKSSQQALLQKRVISHKEKKQLLQVEANYNRSWFNPNRISTLEHPTYFENVKAFHQYITTYPITNCFTTPLEEDIPFPCIFTEGNSAWVYADQEGHYRYCSQYKKELTIAFDLIDLIQITENVSPIEVYDVFQEWIGAEVGEEPTEKKILDKYQDNLTRFHNLLHSKEEVASFLKPLQAVYEELQYIASSPEYLTKQIHEQSLFFASTRYLAEKIGSIHHTNVSRIINALDAIGLIRKVTTAEITPLYKKYVKEWTNRLGYKQAVGFFIIPHLEDVEKEMIRKIRKIKSLKLSYRDFTNTKKTELFGSKQEIEISSLEVELMERFNRLLILKGHVSKNFLIQSKNTKEAEEIVKKRWNSWVKNANCQCIRPTKEMQKKMHLKGFGYIAVPKEDQE